MRDNISELYKALQDTYELGSEDDFRNYLNDGDNREALRKELEAEWEVGDSTSFARYLGIEDNTNKHNANAEVEEKVDENDNAKPDAKPWEAKVAGVPSLYDIADKQREETPKMPNYRHEVSVDEEGGKISKPVVKWQPDKAERAEVEKQMTEMRQNIEQSKEDIDTKNKYIGGLTEKPFDTGMQRIEIGNTESVFQQRNPRVVETDAKYNTETGEFEKGYINEAGEYNNKAMAERDQKQIDRSRYIDMHPDYAGRANRNQVANMDRYIDDNLREAQKESAEIIADYIDNASLGALALMEVPKNPMMGGVDTDGFKLENIPTEKAQAAAQRIREFEAASRSMRDAKRIIAEADRAVKEDKYDGWLKRHTLDFAGGVARGFGDKFFDIDTWDFGLTDIKDNSSLMLALDKADKGEELTESQRALLDAKAIELATQAYFGSQVGKGYNAGAVTAESIPFMLEMCINPAASAGTTAASKMARYALKRFAKKAVTEGVEELTERGLMRAAINAGKKSLVKRAALGGRIVGDLVAGAGVTATTGSGRVLADTMDRMAGEVKYDENELGLASYAGRENQKEFGEAFAKAFASGTIENYSEMVGEYFSPILGVAGKYIGKGLDKMKLGFINDAIENISASKLAKAVNDFESHAKYSGSIGEFSEEIAGGILNSIFVGDQTLDTNEQTGVFNPDNLIDTYLGVSIFGGVMSGVKTFGYRTPKYRAKQNMVEQDKIGSAMFGNQDKWGQIRNTIAVGSEEDIAAVLQEVKNDDSLTQEQKMQAFKYAAYAMNYKGVLMAEQKRREEQPREHTDFETSFDNGYSLEGQEMNDAMNMYDMRREKAVQVLGEDKVAELDANPVDAMAGIDTEEQLQVATDYVNAKATFDGMGQKVLDDINAQIADSEKNLNELTSKTDGKIHPVTLKGERKAHIVDGNLAVTDNGEIDAANSDLSILVRDDETGKIEFVSPSDIVTSDGAIDAEEEKANVAQAIRDAVTRQADAQMNGILPFNVGNEYNVLDDEGNAHTIAVVDNGQEGQVLVSVDGENVARMMPRDEVQKMANNANLARLAEHEAKKETKKQMENGETSGEADNNNVGAHEPLAATPDAMPMIGEGEDAEPDFMATTPERGHLYLYDEAGIPKAAADNMVTAHINAAEKEVKKQSDALAKLDANPGTSISAYKAKQADIKGKLDAAQAAYDYWNGVKTEQGKRDEAERQAAFAAQTADASGRQNELAAQKTPKEKIDAAKQMYGEYFDSDFTVPYDAMELVAMNMPNEKISWEGREGVRGLQQELGSNFKRGIGRDKGTNAFNIYLAKKGEGISTDEAIYSIYESAENTLPNGEHRWDVEEIRSAFIDMFMGAEKPSDIRDYVLNNRIRQAEQMRAAEDEAAEMARLDDEIMQRTGMEREEYAAWIAELEARADAQAAYENEVYNETNTSNDRETEGSIGEEGSGQVQGQEGDTTGVEEDGAEPVGDRGRNEGTQGDTTERQEGDLAQAKVTARLSSEVNEFDKPFVLASNGTTTFGEVSKDSGLTEAPIKLSLGENRIDEEGGNHGYGLLHIEAGHGEQIRAAGFNSVEEFVETVAKNYDTIREGGIVANNQTYLLEISDEHNNTLFIQLSRDGKYWNVNSAGIFKKKYSRRKQEVYTRPALEPGTNTDSRGVDSGLSDGVTAPAGNSPETSASKGTENSETDKETEQKFNKGERFLLASGAVITIEDVDDKGERTFTWKSINNDNVHTSKATIEELEVMGARPLESVQESVAKAEKETDTNPTEGQKKAGNYKKGHVKIDGYDVSIEQPKGSVRSGVDANGKKWEQTMNNTYGYIRGTEGVDGDHIDVFLSDNIDDWNGMVYVVDQVNNDGSFDEHKVMYGFNSAEEARAAYLSNYEEGWQGLGTMTGVTKEEFKKWVESSHRKTKPFAEYKSVQEEEGQNESTINGAVDMATMQPVMGEEAFAELLESGDREMMEAYLKEIEHALRLGDNAPLDGKKEVQQDYKKAVEQYGKDNIPEEVLDELTKRIEPYNNLERTLFDRKYALEEKLRGVEAAERIASAEKKDKEKAAHKQTAYNGFLADKTALGADAAEKALSKRINIEGEVMTVAEFVEKQHQSGSLVPSISEEPKYKGVSKRAWNRMDAAQQAAEEERVKNGGTKSVYRLNGYDLGKTAYDYAQYLMKNNNDNVDKAEKAKPKETASIKEVVLNYVQAYRNWADDIKNDDALKAWQNARKELEGRLNELSDEELEGLKSQLGGDFANIADFVGDISRRRTQNRELSNAFDEGMKAQKEISGTAKAPKVVLDNFTANDELRLVLNGVHHDEDGFAVATNGMILIADKRQYDEANKGKTIISHKVGNSAKKGDIVDFRFPNWKMVVKAHPNGSTASVTFDGLRKFLAGVEEVMKSRWNTEKENGNTKQSFASWSSEANIAIRMPKGEVCVYKYNGLSKFADAAANMGMTDIYYAAYKALVAANENGYVLLMPTIPNILTEEESLSYDAGRRFFYEWNSSSADRLHSKPNEQGKTETEKHQKSEKKSSARASSVVKIDDFGEKIGGARKDLARGRIRDIKGYTTKDLTTLKKGADDILSQANILRLYKDGQMDEQTARGFLAMNNAVKVAIKKYGRTAKEIILNKYRDAAVAWEEGRAAEFGITDADVAAYMAGFDITEEKARKDLDYCITETFDMYMLTYQAMNYPAVERKLGQYVIVDYGSMRSRRIPLSRPFWVKTSYTSGRGYPFATLEGAMEKLNQLCPEVKPKDTEKKEKGEKAEHGLRVTKEGFGFYVKSRNIPGNIYLSPKFTSEKQAQAYMEENFEQLKAREQRLVDALMGSNIGMAEREGVDYRNGKDVTPQDFLDEFGFRGVEFGNWVPQGERQMYLNKTYDAIKDFCAIVGISPKAFSLGGRLGLAFGARGSGRALAHYEPGKEAINLTRMSGVGSLAHEWFHALDNILAKQETGNTSDMATMRYDVVREEVSAVLKEMYRVMKAMDYDMRSRRAGEYWGRTEEEFARLFENYIYNKLAEKEVTSPILVRKDILFDDAEEVSKNRWPYPSVAENATMAPLFDKLFSTIQEKTDEKGNVVLFQKLDGSTLSKEADATEMMMRDALIETIEGAGIEVVTDVAIGQQVLDENANATREMRVYHGSGADFDAFDHSHMGEGEGAQAYGWGTYVSEVEGIGKTYAQSVGRNPIGRRPVLYKGESYDAVNTDGWSDEKKGVYVDLVQGMRVMGKSAEQAKDDLRLMTEVNIRNRERSLANLKVSSNTYQSIAEDKRKQEERLKHINEFNADDFTREGSTPTLYTVEIPEENAAYYIGYNERMREQQDIVEMADNELAAQGWRRQEIGEQMVFTNSEGKRIVFTPNQTGADFYEEFVVALGSKKAASEFLSSVGITGIKYPAEFRSGGRTDGASNYVIFDESNIEITNKARLFRTSNGEVYGYTMGGKIYLDTRIATTETPIHEYSHLWSEALEQANPKAWEQLKNDLVKDTELMDYVKGLYPEIKDENELMHEVFAHFSGKRGRARLEEMRKEEAEKANGLLDKARIIAMFQRLKELLGRYWTMARDLFAGSVKGLYKMKAEDFADMAMADLLGGFNPGAAAKNATAKKDAAYMEAVKNGDMETAQKMVDEAAKKAMPNTKVVDESGNPLVVFHGTTEDFTVFDHTKARTNMDIQGMFFSPWELDAKGYGENTRGFYLNITNPASFGVGLAALRKFQGQNGAGTKAREYLIEQGYDGVNNDNEEYIAFYPEQIKSADAVTYDDNGNVIPLSERFNKENNDIRYQFVGEQGAAEAVKIHYDALAQKYHGKPYRIVMSIDEMADEDFLKEIGITDEELAKLTTDEIRENAKEQKEYTKAIKIGGGYNPNTGKIVIFAENIPSLKETEDTFFHENLHGILHELYGDNPQSIALRFWDAAEKWSDKKSIIAEAYRNESEHRQKEEFFVYLMSRAMLKGRVDDVLSVLTEEDAERVENILGILGYDRQTEELDRRREKGNDRENHGQAQEKLGQDVQADRHRRTVDVAEGGKLYRQPMFREGGVLPTYEESLASSKAAGYTKRQHDAWWNRAHKNMRLRANDIAKKLHLEGVVDIYETSDDLNGVEGITEEDKKSKGWYDPKTGRIAIILGNHASAYDVMMTMLHEGVAHFGLRQLFGKNFETFLWNVYSNATPEVRNEINKLMAKNGWNYETATEEYLAGLAEDIDFDRVMKSGWWWMIKDWFVKMLRDIGLGSYVPEGKIGDNELRYVLWRSYYNLELGGAYGTLLGAAIDVAKQYELGVGKFAPKEEVLGVAESGIGMSLEETNRRFNDELQRFDEGQMKSHEVFHLGGTSPILSACGINTGEFRMTQSVLSSHMKKHGLTIDDLFNLPEALKTPIMVYDWGTRVKSHVIITNLSTKDGRKITVAIHVNDDGVASEITDIASVHGKDAVRLISEINNGQTDFGKDNLKWVDKEKALEWLSMASPMEASPTNQELSSAAKVVENFVNPKISAENVEKNAEKLHRSGDGTPRAMARDTYERLVMSGMQQFREAVQDSMLSLKNLYKSILQAEGKEKHIKDVAGYENAYLAENRMHSASQAQISAWTHDFFTPIVEEVYRLVGDSKSAYEELNDYLMAKHGLERNIVLAERDARKEYDRLVKAGQPAGLNSLIKEYREKDYSGLTALTGENNTADAELLAQQMVDDFEASHDTTELWARINAATKSSLEKMFRSGLMSKARYEDIRDMFAYYIPLQGFDEKVAEDMYAYVGSDGTRMYGTPIRSARGRRSKADNPLATIAMNGEAAIRQGNRNEMKQHFLNFVQSHPSDLVSVSDVWLRYNDVTDEWEQYFDAGLKDDDSPEEVERKVRDFNERMEQLAASEPDRYKRGRDAEDIPFRVVSKSNASQHQVIVKRGGKTIVLTINGNPRAAQALNGLTNPDVFTEGVFGKTMNLGQNLNRLLSSLYTTRNPEFVASNYTRDALYSNCMTWVKESPAYAVRFHKNFGMANPAFMAKMFVEWENGELRKKVAQMGNTAKQGSVDYMRKQFYDFMMNGGETGWTSLRDIEAHKKDLEASLKKEGSTSRKAWKALGGTLDIANRAVENCARFSAFVTSREMGRSLERSIYDAKEVSVNFNKKGAGDKFLSAKGQTKLGKTGSVIGGLGRGLYVFFNAGVQGMANYMGAAKHNPAKLAGLSSLLFGLGSIIPIVTAIACGGDDDDEDSYYNLPEYVRRSNLCFRWRKDMPWIKIPLPIEFRAMYGLGELSCGVLTGKERYNDEELTKQYISQVSQVLPLDFMEGGGGWHAFVPSSVKPGVEAYTNKGWTGLPIYKDNKFKEYYPQWTSAYESADKTIVEATRWLNEATGGSDVSQGMIDWNPARIEYMLKGYLGGYYTMFDRLKKSAETAFGKREFEWRNVPIASRFVQEGDERTEARKAKSEYFDLDDEYEKTKSDMNGFKKIAESGRDDAQEYAERLSDLENSQRYVHFQIMENYKPILDAYNAMIKEAEGGYKEELKAEEDALRRELIELIHAVDDEKEVNIEEQIKGDLDVLSQSEHKEIKKAVGSVMAKQLGGKYRSSTTEYGKAYEKIRNLEDITEDLQMQIAIGEAEDSDDVRRKKALDKARSNINTLKQRLGDPDEDDEKTMRDIRKMRRDALKEFGKKSKE